MIYEETYKGVEFHKTCKGYWLFAELLPNLPTSASRYFTDAELSKLETCGDEEAAQYMRNAIDRNLSGNVVR